MRVFGMCRLAACTFFISCGVVALAAPPVSGYHLIKKVPLGKAADGAEYFDYITVDAGARRVYVSHGSEIKILDADTFSVVATISGLKRSHGVALVPELGKGFITDGDAASVVVFDMKTFKKTGEIKSSPDTDAIVYDPASRLIFTFNGDSKNSSVIDPAKETVVKTMGMGGSPEQAAVDGKGTLYDNNAETNEVVVIDTGALTIKRAGRWRPLVSPSP
jgi:DNA-binding beta-propeller fold protein YncE